MPFVGPVRGDVFHRTVFRGTKQEKLLVFHRDDPLEVTAEELKELEKRDIGVSLMVVPGPERPKATTRKTTKPPGAGA